MCICPCEPENHSDFSNKQKSCYFGYWFGRLGGLLIYYTVYSFVLLCSLFCWTSPGTGLGCWYCEVKFSWIRYGRNTLQLYLWKKTCGTEERLRPCSPYNVMTSIPPCMFLSPMFTKMVIDNMRGKRGHLEQLCIF